MSSFQFKFNAFGLFQTQRAPLQRGRALDKWEHQRVLWDDIKRRMSLASGKNAGDLAMERCDEYRKKLEALSHLDMAGAEP
jgi:hypothetical protein